MQHSYAILVYRELLLLLCIQSPSKSLQGNGRRAKVRWETVTRRSWEFKDGLRNYGICQIILGILDTQRMNKIHIKFLTTKQSL